MKKLITTLFTLNSFVIGNKKGAAMIEYALLVAAIAAIAAALFMDSSGTLGTFATTVQNKLNTIANNL